MKTFQKTLTLLLAVVMLVSVFAGCSSTNNESNQSNETNGSNTADNQPAAAPVPQPDAEVAWDTSKQDEIIVTVINGYYTAGEKKLAEEYTKLHPETKVTVDVVADNDSYSLKMQTILADPNATGTSDIVHSNFFSSVAGGAAAALSNGLLLDMSTILDMDHP